MKNRPDYIKRSFALPCELAELLEQERADFEQRHGVPISLNMVAVRAIRAGLRLNKHSDPRGWQLAPPAS